jgi:hypothetical protein
MKYHIDEGKPMLHGLGDGVVDRTDEITREMQKILVDNPPELLSMHNGDNLLNNDIDWSKSSQKFSGAWIDWDSERGALSLDGTENQLEFALDSSRKLYVQNDLTGKGHIDLSCGDNCFCAGTFHFDRNGYLSSIHLDSGHYRPTAEHGKYLIATLMESFYDLRSPGGKRNMEHLLNTINVHVYNAQTKSFDVFKANDIMTGRYLDLLRQQEIIRQEALQRKEREIRIVQLAKLVDSLLTFNAEEHARISKQTPKTGKDDHKKKVAAFQANVAQLSVLNESVRGRDINEDDLKNQIKLMLESTKEAANI